MALLVYMLPHGTPPRVVYVYIRLVRTSILYDSYTHVLVQVDLHAFIWPYHCAQRAAQSMHEHVQTA